MFWKLLEQTVGVVCTQPANERTHLTNRKSNEENILPHVLWSILKNVKDSTKIFPPKGFNLEEIDVCVQPLLKRPPWELGNVAFGLLSIRQGWWYFCFQLINLSNPQCFTEPQTTQAILMRMTFWHYESNIHFHRWQHD